MLTDLFNQILTEKKVPASFKTGVITSVLKKGKDSKCIEKYKGITVSSVLGKLFEYTVLNKNFKYSSQIISLGLQKDIRQLWPHC